MTPPATISREAALSVCASEAFATALSSGGPYAGYAELVEAARSIWWRLPATEWLTAFAAHPKIGDRRGVADKPKAFGEFSRGEQAAAAGSLSEVLASELADWNQRYFDKFGFIFIICAKGKSSSEILAALKERYSRLPYQELPAAAREQMKITELRLASAVEGAPPAGDAELQARTQRRADQVLQQLAASGGSPARSPITTHVLDQALGKPAAGLRIELSRYDAHSRAWEPLARGATNADGRVGNLLPPGNFVSPGRYRMHFDTAAYLEACRQRFPNFYGAVPFYPEVAIDFEIAPEQATEHYHIPLLLSPFGYSTYRGS